MVWRWGWWGWPVRLDLRTGTPSVDVLCAACGTACTCVLENLVRGTTPWLLVCESVSAKGAMLLNCECVACYIARGELHHLSVNELLRGAALSGPAIV